VVLEEGVAEDDEFAHDCGYGDLGGLSGGDERLVFGLETGVAADRDEGRHVEDLAQACAAAADEAHAFPLAAFAGDVGEADKACGFPAFESSEFRHLDQQGESGGGSDAWNADEALEARPEAGIGLGEAGEFGVDDDELGGDLFEALRCLTLEQGDGEVFLAVLRGDATLDESAARDKQFLHLVVGGAGQGAHGRPEQGAEAQEHGRIDPIGFGAPAECFGVSPRLARIDLDHRQASGAERALEGTMIGAGGLEDDACWRMRGEPGVEGRKPPDVIAEALCRAVRVRQTSRWSFEMSMPAVCAIDEVIFSMSYASHPGRHTQVSVQAARK
jgi:hypothetical protein